MRFFETWASRVVLVAVLCPFSHAASIFNFDADTRYKQTTFTDTNNGLSATFSGSGGPQSFMIDSVPTLLFNSLSGKTLMDPGFSHLNQLDLTIVFSSNVSNISLNFAENSSAGVPFFLSAFEDNVLVGQSSVTGVIATGFTYPEGLISFNGAVFNSVQLSAPAALDFMIDNVNVTPVPEPGTLSLILLPVVGTFRIGYGNWRRRSEC